MLYRSIKKFMVLVLMRKAVIILVVSILFLVTLSLHSMACFDPWDRGSIEVVFNKPGASLDVEKLESLDNVLVKDSEMGKVYIYRSHFVKDLVVILRMQSLSLSGPSYPSIRVESPMKTINYYMLISNPLVLGDRYKILVSEAEELGWSVENITRDNEFIALVFRYRTDNYHVKISYDSDRVLAIIITSTISMSDAVQGYSVVKEFLAKAFSPPISMESLVFRKAYIPVSQPVVERSVIREAFSKELEWLINNGILKGISMSDLEEISEKARPGLAGWNNRIVYYASEPGHGVWIPYYMTPDAVLVKNITGCSIRFSEAELPENPPPMTTSSGMSWVVLGIVALIIISLALGLYKYSKH